ncbi:MAG: Gfo/Idh/MocA family oxidoreductase [Pirellulales bacterium]|nr:Gfo/Idh/MocA family oxidoreductase [Pirellulales bacterium]
MRDIGVAVIGAGFIGPVHVEALRRVGVNVVGVLGVSDEESRQTAAALDVPKAYSGFAELLGDKNVHAAHIAVPNRLHFEMAREALRAGKHVICEKPLAMNSEESGELVALAKETGLAAGVNYNLRYYPLCLEMREMVRGGQLGEVFSICGSYVQDWLLYPTDYNWRVLVDEGGELRAVADIGTHWLDLVRSISGLEVEAVCADLRTVYPTRQRPKGEVETFTGKGAPPAETEPVEIGTEDYGCIMLRMAGGARGVLWVSQVTAGRKNCLRVEIAGSKSALAWESEKPNEVWIGHRDQPNQLMLRDPALVCDATRPFIGYPGGHNEGFPDTFKQCFRTFYDYIEAGDFSVPAPFPTFADGHQEILLCEAIARSNRQGGWVEIKGGAL